MTMIRTGSARTRPRPVGSAYVFVLGITLIVTVLGMGALTLSRVTARAAAEGNGWEAAGTLAFSATEHAVSFLNAAAAASPSGWRAGYAGGATAFTQAAGGGQFAWAIKDEVDGNLAGDYLHAFRVYGIGRVGGVTRVYSVRVAPAGTPLDVLRTALHSSAAVTLTDNARAAGGPISGNASVKLGGTVNAAIEAAAVTGSASGTQTVTAPAPAKTMPSPALFDDLVADATVIPWGRLSGSSSEDDDDEDSGDGTIRNCLLSPTANPFGTPNAKGLYAVKIPGSSKLTINKSRIVGTLLVGGANKNTINIDGPVEWETGPAGAPILVASGRGMKVSVGGSNTWLSESAAGVNFNPAACPFEGRSDADKLDDFPPQFRGIIHVIAGSTGSLELKTNAYVVGTVIADCPVKATGQLTLVQDPAIYAKPPFGYATGDALAEVPGTWRWDTLP